jgi:hypothetical protein
MVYNTRKYRGRNCRVNVKGNKRGKSGPSGKTSSSNTRLERDGSK